MTTAPAPLQWLRAEVPRCCSCIHRAAPPSSCTNSHLLGPWEMSDLHVPGSQPHVCRLQESVVPTPRLQAEALRGLRWVLPHGLQLQMKVQAAQGENILGGNESL